MSEGEARKPVPGVRVLSSYDHYDLATELPAAKNAKLVFYCANTL